MKTSTEDGEVNWVQIVALSEQLGDLLLERKLQITTAESCTGGLIAGALTEVAGSSGWFQGGAVTYSNDAKNAMLGVPTEVFEQSGAVSEACVQAMAVGALREQGADMAISVSGIAGPGGAVAGKPVGTVWIAWAFKQDASSSAVASGTVTLPPPNVDATRFQLAGNRSTVRLHAVYQALRGIITRLENPENLFK